MAVAGSAAVRPAAGAAARAAASRFGRRRGPEQVEARRRDPRSRGRAAAASASPRRSSGTAGSRARRPRARGCRARSPRSRARATRRSRPRCRGTPRSRRPARPSPSKAKPSTAARISLPKPAALERRGPSHDPVSTVRWIANSSAFDRLGADRAAVQLDHRGSGTSASGDQRAARPPVVLHEAALERRARDASTRRPRTASRRAGGCRPSRPARSSARSSSVGMRSTRCSVRRRSPKSGQASSSRGRPWAADGTLRPWVLSRRWKTSSRS